MNPVIIASIAGSFGAVMVADWYADTQTRGLDPEGPGAASGTVGPTASVISTIVSSTMTLRANHGNLPTAEQLAEWKRKVHRTSDPNLVPRVRTALPPGNSPMDLRPLMAEFVRGGVPGGDKGAFILCVLASVECNAGIVANTSVACYNHNLGNQKLGNAATNDHACYFLVDRALSLDMYPSFSSFAEYTPAWLRLLGNSNYNRSGMLGATRSLENGNIREFNAALGTGGYAASYRAPNYLAPRAKRLIRNGALPALQIVGLE